MPPDPRALAVYLDVLVPGDAEWPSASTAVGEVSRILVDLSPEDVRWLTDAVAGIAAGPVDSRAAAMAALESEDPEPFSRVLAALYRAYYATAAAQAQVHRLAEAAPREPSATFDPALLAAVIDRQAGRRRI